MNNRVIGGGLFIPPAAFLLLLLLLIHHLLLWIPFAVSGLSLTFFFFCPPPFHGRHTDTITHKSYWRCPLHPLCVSLEYLLSIFRVSLQSVCVCVFYWTSLALLSRRWLLFTTNSSKSAVSFSFFFYFVAVVIFDVLSLATFYILRHSIGGLRRDRRLLSMCRSRNVHRKILGEKYANEPLGFVRRSSRWLWFHSMQMSLSVSPDGPTCDLFDEEGVFFF